MSEASYQNYAQAIKDGRVVHLAGDVNGDLVSSFRKQVREALEKQGDKEIVVVLKTRGGSAEEGYAIYNELQALASTGKVILICESYVCSMGIYMLLALPREKRYTFPNTTFYCHRATMTWKTDLKGPVEMVEYAANECLAAVDWHRRINRSFMEILVKQTNLNPEEAASLLDNPRYLEVEEAQRLGFVHGVISPL
jgi:ATP-dependent protease ClpP protease subunit